MTGWEEERGRVVGGGGACVSSAQVSAYINLAISCWICMYSVAKYRHDKDVYSFNLLLLSLFYSFILNLDVSLV